MPDILQEKERKARKPHVCDYCGKTIEKGEAYEWAKLKYDGTIYEWKNHKKCGFIASELWSYIDPDNGMTEEDFQEGCREFCHAFVCPKNLKIAQKMNRIALIRYMAFCKRTNFTKTVGKAGLMSGSAGTSHLTRRLNK